MLISSETAAGLCKQVACATNLSIHRLRLSLDVNGVIVVPNLAFMTLSMVGVKTQGRVLVKDLGGS